MEEEGKILSQFLRVARWDDLVEGRGTAVKVGEFEVALFKEGESIHAIGNVCPHRMAPLAHGWVENGKVYCPMHGWDFNLRTGACGVNPSKPVRRFDARVVDGWVEVLVGG